MQGKVTLWVALCGTLPIQKCMAIHFCTGEGGLPISPAIIKCGTQDLEEIAYLLDDYRRAPSRATLAELRDWCTLDDLRAIAQAVPELAQTARFVGVRLFGTW